jgi:hypothetical protein
MSEKITVSNSKSSSWFRRVLLRLAIVLGLALLVFGVIFPERAGELVKTWTMSDEEAARLGAEREKAEAYEIWRQGKLRELASFKEDQKREREAETEAWEETIERRTRAKRAQEMLDKYAADVEQSDKLRAFERTLSDVQGVMPLEKFDEMSNLVKKRLAELSIRPLGPAVLFSLLGAGVRAIRKHIRDKIFGSGLQEIVMKELLDESVILGGDRPEGEKKKILETITDSLLEVMKSGAN